MAFPDRRTSNVLLTILFFFLVFTVLYAARRVLLIFVFAILFAYLIDPVVRFLQHRSLFFKNLRGPHVVEAYLAFLIVAALSGQGLAPLVSTPANTFLKEMPAWLNSVTTGDIAVTIGNARGWTEPQELRLKAFLVGHREKIQSLASAAEQFASNALVTLVVVPILAVFFLADGRRIADSFIQLVSTERNHQTIREVAEELNTMLRKYIRAKVILGGCSLVFYSAAMLSLKFPNAISLGVLGGVLEFVPVAGWMSSAAMIAGVGILTHRHWIWMAVLLGIWRMAMDLLHIASRLGKKSGNPPFDRVVRCHGRRGNRWNRGHLPFHPPNGGDSCHLAQMCLPGSATSAAFRSSSSRLEHLSDRTKKKQPLQSSGRFSALA
jgi:predicted PurR-regulated permease PerM